MSHLRRLLSPGLELRRFFRTPMTRAAIVAVMLFPLLYGALYLWAFWDPTGRVDQIPAAIVNLDQPTSQTTSQTTGETTTTVHAGDDLTSQLLKKGTLDWTKTDAASARQGLENGQYFAVVTIPQNFSASIASIGTQHPVQAPMQVTYNDANGYTGRTILTAVLKEVRTQASSSIGEQAVGHVLVGMDEIHSGLVQAAGGSNELATGAAQAGTAAANLATGAHQVATGAQQVAGGAASAHDGSSTLVTGAQQVSTGASQVNTAAQRLKAGSAQVSTGATQVDSAVLQLTTGSAQVATGASQANTAAQQLKSGSAQVATGASQLGSQLPKAHKAATQVAQGAAQVSTGATQLKTGLAQANQGGQQVGAATTQLKTGSAQVATGAQALADALAASDPQTQAALQAFAATLTPEQRAQFQQLMTAQQTKQQQAASAAQQIATGAQTVAAGNAKVANQVPALTGGLSQAAAAADELATGASQVSTGATQLSTGLQQASTGASQLATGAQQVADGNAKLAANTPSLASGAQQVAGGTAQLATNTPKLASGASQVAQGNAQLAANTPKLASGAQQVAQGAVTLDQGLAQLETGSAKASSGATQVSSGASQLKTGIAKVSQGASTLHTKLADAAKDVPTFGDSADANASVMASPVSLSTSYLHQALVNGVGFAPYFLGLAMYVGALILWMILRPITQRSLSAPVRASRVVLSNLRSGVLVAAAQSVILSAVVMLGLGLDPAHPVAFVGFGLLVSTTFVALLQALNIWLGPAVGRLLAMVLMMLQLTSAGGTYPIETTPAFFQAMHQVLPMTFVVDGFREAITGALDARFWAATLFLVGLMAVCVGMAIWGAARNRTWTVTRLHPAVSL